MPLTHKLLNDKLIFIIFFLLGLFPILPFSLKPFTITIAIIYGFYTFLKEKKISYSKLHIISASLFFLYLISIIYSADKAYSLKRLETTLSLVIIPAFFILISSINAKNKDVLKYETIFQITFYISSIIFCLIMFAYLWQLGYYNGQVTYDYGISYIEQMLWGFNEHPIYISIFLSISILFSFKLFSNKGFRGLVILGNIILAWSLIFLSRKAILLGLFISFIFLINNSLKKLKHKLLIIFFITIGFIFSYELQPSSFNRIREVFESSTYTKVIDEDNSTNLRLNIYKCAFQNIPNAGLLGYGIGDVKDVLLDCYKNTSSILVKWKNNTHNQYLNTIMACGIIGIIIFIFILVKLLSYAYYKGDYLFLSILIFYSIIMMTENVLDRQNGVILYSLLINFYIFKNHLNSKKLNA